MNEVTVHLVPDPLGGQGVLTDQEFPEPCFYEVGFMLVDRTGQAGKALVRVDRRVRTGDRSPALLIGPEFAGDDPGGAGRYRVSDSEY